MYIFICIHSYARHSDTAMWKYGFTFTVDNTKVYKVGNIKHTTTVTPKKDNILMIQRFDFIWPPSGFLMIPGFLMRTK